MIEFKHLICPVCKTPLRQTSQVLSCTSGHSFDVAGKGYVNLLLSQDKHSKDPGDNKDMAKARKRFLDKGYYSLLAQGLSNIFSQKLASGKRKAILFDAGCGDGYYTNRLKKTFSDNQIDCSVYGMDISKEAIRLAAGRNKEIGFLVASLFKIPFADNQADFVLNAFAPASDSEFQRILKKDGLLLTVIPGKSHLFELKAVLYDNPYENDENEPELPSFKSYDQVRLKSRIKIDSPDDLADLLTMTPYYWRTPREGLDRFGKLTSLETSIEFIIGLHSKL